MSQLNISEIAELYHFLTNTNETADNVTMYNVQTVRGSYQTLVPEKSLMDYLKIILPIVGGVIVIAVVITIVVCVRRRRRQQSAAAEAQKERLRKMSIVFARHKRDAALADGSANGNTEVAVRTAGSPNFFAVPRKRFQRHDQELKMTPLIISDKWTFPSQALVHIVGATHSSSHIDLPSPSSRTLWKAEGLVYLGTMGRLIRAASSYRSGTSS